MPRRGKIYCSVECSRGRGRDGAYALQRSSASKFVNEGVEEGESERGEDRGVGEEGQESSVSLGTQSSHGNVQYNDGSLDFASRREIEVSTC